MKWQESAIIEPTREEYEAAMIEREQALRGCGGCKTVFERHDCGCILDEESPECARVIQMFEGRAK